MEAEPSPTRESVNFDHEFAVALFDELIDKYQQGELTYAEAIGQYTVGVLEHLDGQAGRSSRELPEVPPALD